MSPEHNEFILSTAYHSGWITLEQYHSSVEALQATPELSAIDFLVEEAMIQPEEAEGLRQALGPVATVQADADIPRPRIVSQPEETSEGGLHNSGSAQVTELVIGVDMPGSMGVADLLRMGFEAGASDVHLGVSAPALMRRNGTLQPLCQDTRPLTPAQTDALVRSFLNPLQLDVLEKKKALDFSYEVPGLARFRASVVQQRRGLDAVFRIINTRVRTMDELNLPQHLKVLTQYQNGLVLVTGAVGSGKSTTLAAMVQEVNMHRKDHIITLEDPIEYVFVPDGCQITQREVHAHTESFSAALRASLREDPDVIIVGEMRDLETISLAITASETGHLVIATLHTSNAARTLDRVLDAFPVEQQSQIRTMVSESLRGIISQQLIPKADGTGRVVALEIMVNTPAVANLIREAKTFMLPGIIQTGKKLGMKLMDDALIELIEQGQISPYEARDRAEQKQLIEPYLK